MGINLNNPPNIDRPFVDPITLLPSYETTVYAGTLVNLFGWQSAFIVPGILSILISIILFIVIQFKLLSFNLSKIFL